MDTWMLPLVPSSPRRARQGSRCAAKPISNLNQYDSAISSYQKLVASYPSNSSRINLARAEIEAGEYQKAQTALLLVSDVNQAYVLDGFCDLLSKTPVPIILTAYMPSPEALQAVQRA